MLLRVKMDFVEILGNVITTKDLGGILLAPFLKKRVKMLQEVILSEIRQGNFSQVYEDDKIAISYRLMRDALEGVAKNNLCLMARLICGLAEKEQLTAHNFQKYAKILADLDYEEVEILAEIVKKYESLPPRESEEYEFAKHRLVDSLLFDKFGAPPPKDAERYSEIYVRLNRLERTGFILKRGGGFATSKDGIYGSPFTVTSFFEQFLQFCPNWSDLAYWQECNK